MGDTHVGLQARLMSQALRKLTASLSAGPLNTPGGGGAGARPHFPHSPVRFCFAAPAPSLCVVAAVVQYGSLKAARWLSRSCASVVDDHHIIACGGCGWLLAAEKDRRKHPSALIFINQLRQKIGVMYAHAVCCLLLLLQYQFVTAACMC